jgi:hypothetical protein
MFSAKTDPGKGRISGCSSISSAATGSTRKTTNVARIVTSNPLLPRIFNLPFRTEKDCVIFMYYRFHSLYKYTFFAQLLEAVILPRKTVNVICTKITLKALAETV